MLGRRGSARRRWWAALAAIPLVGLLVQVPQAGAANEVHLVAAGDFGARAATDTVLTKMAQLAPDASWPWATSPTWIGPRSPPGAPT